MTSPILPAPPCPHEARLEQAAAELDRFRQLEELAAANRAAVLARRAERRRTR